MPSSNVTEISSKTPPLNLLIIEPGNANHSSVIKAQVKRQSHLYPAMLNQADNSEVNLRNVSSFRGLHASKRKTESFVVRRKTNK